MITLYRHIKQDANAAVILPWRVLPAMRLDELRLWHGAPRPVSDRSSEAALEADLDREHRSCACPTEL